MSFHMNVLPECVLKQCYKYIHGVKLLDAVVILHIEVKRKNMKWIYHVLTGVSSFILKQLLLTEMKTESLFQMVPDQKMSKFQFAERNAFLKRE